MERLRAGRLGQSEISLLSLLNSHVSWVLLYLFSVTYDFDEPEFDDISSNAKVHFQNKHLNLLNLMLRYIFKINI